MDPVVRNRRECLLKLDGAAGRYHRGGEQRHDVTGAASQQPGRCRRAGRGGPGGCRRATAAGCGAGCGAAPGRRRAAATTQPQQVGDHAEWPIVGVSAASGRVTPRTSERN